MATSAKSPAFQVNNEVYHELGERWYTAQDDPIALLRAESRTRTPWVISEMEAHNMPRDDRTRVLDIGCGAGFLANPLAAHGYDVTGLDASRESLAVAAAHDTTGKAHYLHGDATRLDFPPGTFDVVTAMDFLEHVEDPSQVVREAARMLRPGGLFFFHTFNRNLVSWLIVIKGVEWFVRNVPVHLHQWRYLVKPRDLRQMCLDADMTDVRMHGLVPEITRPAFWRMLATGCVGDDFAFRSSRSLLTGYSGVAVKK
ncbi:MAG: bifunctional 2-polyprenyl-6-hydroxyphenol methylase/3-demethylubiquinol 3-O-methyltransferase UbiG [Blastocatellia bacterium]